MVPHLVKLLACVLLVSSSMVVADASKPALLYHNYCSVCHGDKGDGDSHASTSLNPPPRDFTSPEVAVSLGRERMLTAIREGVSGTAMAGWKDQLSESEIEALADYVRDRFMLPVASKGAGRGRRLYAETCSVCHGDRGKGAIWAKESLNPSPRDFTTAAARRELTRERMMTSVSYGRPGTAMTGFAQQLDKSSIGAVVDYVRTAFMQPDLPKNISGTRAHGAPASPNSGNTIPVFPESGNLSSTVGVDMKASLPGGLTGHAEKGRAIYMQGCATCHGVLGDGAGPRAYFINPRPRNFLLDASRRSFNRPALFRAIANGKPGTEMPAWEKVLDKQQIADITEFVFINFIRPEAQQN
ncbi:Cytochrome c oxidase polypeptide II [hydrothermal vent metagenome]|uniref:Cytochrome c oxidase polypeptide II n=1 Tax=hydrothermal vent metagenome TaxID=652676 RepID=A0A3B0YDZ7_9ZZZZ